MRRQAGSALQRLQSHRPAETAPAPAPATGLPGVTALRGATEGHELSRCVLNLFPCCPCYPCCPCCPCCPCPGHPGEHAVQPLPCHRHPPHRHVSGWHGRQGHPQGGVSRQGGLQRVFPSDPVQPACLAPWAPRYAVYARLPPVYSPTHHTYLHKTSPSLLGTSATSSSSCAPTWTASRVRVPCCILAPFQALCSCLAAFKPCFSLPAFEPTL